MPESTPHPLYMSRLRLSLPSVMSLAHRQQLPLHDVDVGYLVHCFMGSLFGDLAPSPFAVVGQEHAAVEVLAYGHHGDDRMRAYADAFADPGVHAGCDWTGFAQKAMPSAWDVGRRVAFRARVCPVVRTWKDGPNRRSGAEVDVFLAHCPAPGEPAQPRQSVYPAWFVDQVERRGGAYARGVRLDGFTLRRLVRRTHDHIRRSTVALRPDATVRGVLEVTDGAAFSNLIARGIGRHRAFGFGMLLLAPT